jgi:hypothetical protein
MISGWLFFKTISLEVFWKKKLVKFAQGPRKPGRKRKEMLMLCVSVLLQCV